MYAKLSARKNNPSSPKLHPAIDMERFAVKMSTCLERTRAVSGHLDPSTRHLVSLQFHFLGNFKYFYLHPIFFASIKQHLSPQRKTHKFPLLDTAIHLFRHVKSFKVELMLFTGYTIKLNDPAKVS